jgi:hypothetical protein
LVAALSPRLLLLVDSAEIKAVTMDSAATPLSSKLATKAVIAARSVTNANGSRFRSSARSDGETEQGYLLPPSRKYLPSRRRYRDTDAPLRSSISHFTINTTQ